MSLQFTLPYGSGSVVYDPRNTTRPYVARRYDSNDEHGNPRYIYLGSFPSELEAQFALFEASHKTNEELRSQSLLFKDVYRLLITDFKSIVAPTALRRYAGYFRTCSTLHELYYRDISVLQMQTIINKEDSATKQGQLRTFFKKMDCVASAIDCIQKQRSQFLTARKYQVQEPRIPFSDREIAKMLQLKFDPDMQLALILVYTGMRGGELRNLKKTNVNLEQQYLICGIKTTAGKNRTIPIHPIISPFIKCLMVTSPSEYLLSNNRGEQIQKDAYYKRIYRAISLVKEREHHPHEFRHTFRTRLDDMHGNPICIDRLMGHQTPNPVDRIYAHKSIDQLRETIMLLWPEDFTTGE